jgi:hypothetical protein
LKNYDKPVNELTREFFVLPKSAFMPIIWTLVNFIRLMFISVLTFFPQLLNLVPFQIPFSRHSCYCMLTMFLTGRFIIPKIGPREMGGRYYEDGRETGGKDCRPLKEGIDTLAEAGGKDLPEVAGG